MRGVIGLRTFVLVSLLQTPFYVSQNSLLSESLSIFLSLFSAMIDWVRSWAIEIEGRNIRAGLSLRPTTAAIFSVTVIIDVARGCGGFNWEEEELDGELH